MPKKVAWPSLSHEQQIQILAKKPIEQILVDYELPGSDPEAFRAYLTTRMTLWTPKNLRPGMRVSDAAPTKNPLRELIDNSID